MEIILFMLPLLTLLSHVFLLFYVPIYLWKGSRGLKKAYIYVALAVALTATLGSLFFSEVMRYEPCELCWYQRIFMYPQPILIGMSILLGDRKIARYIVPLSLIGGSISVFHYYLQRFPSSYACGPGEVSCAVTYSFDYGYITIPMMALTAFAMTGFFTWASGRSSDGGSRK